MKEINEILKVPREWYTKQSTKTIRVNNKNTGNPAAISIYDLNSNNKIKSINIKLTKQDLDGTTYSRGGKLYETRNLGSIFFGYNNPVNDLKLRLVLEELITKIYNCEIPRENLDDWDNYLKHLKNTIITREYPNSETEKIDGVTFSIIKNTRTPHIMYAVAVKGEEWFKVNKETGELTPYNVKENVIIVSKYIEGLTAVQSNKDTYFESLKKTGRYTLKDNPMCTLNNHKVKLIGKHTTEFLKYEENFKEQEATRKFKEKIITAYPDLKDINSRIKTLEENAENHNVKKDLQSLSKQINVINEGLTDNQELYSKLETTMNQRFEDVATKEDLIADSKRNDANAIVNRDVLDLLKLDVNALKAKLKTLPQDNVSKSDLESLDKTLRNNQSKMHKNIVLLKKQTKQQKATIDNLTQTIELQNKQITDLTQTVEVLLTQKEQAKQEYENKTVFKGFLNKLMS